MANEITMKSTGLVLGILITLCSLIGCSTTSIKDVYKETYYKDGSLKKKVILKRAGNANLFTQKQFSSIKAIAGESNVIASKYSADVNSEAIKATGGAIGEVSGEAGRTFVGIP